MSGLVFILIVVGSIIFAIAVIARDMERKKVDAMTPEQRKNNTWGYINIQLICPHCQTKGTVRTKQQARTVTSTGKIGGILKTNTTTTTTNTVMQHHCDNCGSTWDI